MSLCRFALRHAAVEALRGQTIVGDNVRNSDFAALDIAADGSVRDTSDKPFILVYTDDASVEGEGYQTLQGNGSVVIVIESGIAAAMATFDEDTGESAFTGYGVPSTDTGMEAALDIIDHQIARQLSGGGEWAELFNRMHNGITKIERKRATMGDGGTRLAARQIRIWVDAKRDPVPGAPLTATSIWKEFEAAVIGSEVEAITAALLGSPGDTLSYEHVKARFGLTEPEATALRVGPLDPNDPDATISGYEVETTLKDETEYDGDRDG